MARRVTAVILAGGESARYGSDKAFALWEGKPFLACVASALRPVADGFIVLAPARASPVPYAKLVPGATVVADRDEGAGPVVALRGAISLVRTPTLVVAPCDAPGLPTGLVRRLVAFSEESNQAAVAAAGSGPLFSIFAAPTALIRERLATAQRMADLVSGAEHVATDANGLNENAPQKTAKPGPA